MIAAAENAILARLKAASDAGRLGYRFKTLESYPANWDYYFRDKTPRSPGAWAVFAGMRDGQSVGFGGLRMNAQFGVVVMAENARNETAQRHGGPDAAEPGSYQLVDDVIGLLQGQDLGVFAGPIMVRAVHFVRTEEIVKSRPISMIAIEIEAPLAFEGEAIDAFGVVEGATAGSIGDFTTFHIDWDVPPFGGIDADPTAPGVQLPDDTHADAAQTITLETH